MNKQYYPSINSRPGTKGDADPEAGGVRARGGHGAGGTLPGHQLPRHPGPACPGGPRHHQPGLCEQAGCADLQREGVGAESRAVPALHSQGGGAGPGRDTEQKVPSGRSIAHANKTLVL